MWPLDRNGLHLHRVTAQRNSGSLFKATIWIIVGVVGLWSLNLTVLLTSDSQGILGERGTFGDMFGAVNALFSGLAFAGVVVAIWYQHIALEESRELAEQLQKREAAMDLFRMWHSPDMLAARAEAHRAAHAWKAQDKKPDFDQDLSPTDQSRIAVVRVISFFDAWRTLHMAKQIDRQLAADLLSPYLEWWNSRYFPSLAEALPEGNHYRNMIRSAMTFCPNSTSGNQ